MTQSYPYGVRPPWETSSRGSRLGSSRLGILDFGHGKGGEKTLAETFLERIEEEGNVEEAFQKSVRLGLRRPGTEKKKVEAYLRRALEKAEEEGRI